jgi:predicted O-methyltransferase YrrM
MSERCASLLYLLARAFQPRRIVELGTNVGISSAYLAAALEMNGQGGRVVTFEVSPYRLRLAKEVHSNLGIRNIDYVHGLFSDTLPGSLEEIGSVDFAFIDGHHQHKPTLDYFDAILHYSTSDAAFVFDDIRWSDGMNRAWSELCSDHRVGLVVDLYSVGICIRSRPAISGRHVYGPIRTTFH